MRISPEFFTTLGVSLAMGRTFTEAEAEVADNNGVGNRDRRLLAPAS